MAGTTHTVVARFGDPAPAREAMVEDSDLAAQAVAVLHRHHPHQIERRGA
jgi:hypothetical protein